MKIISNMQSLFLARSHMTKQDLSSATIASKQQKKFDEIMLQKQEMPDEIQFVNDLKTQIKQELSTTKSQKELEEIKLQVANGAYQVGLEDIVRRMMY